MNGPAGPALPVTARRPVNGILLLDKPEGLTSNAALQRVRRLYRAQKAGHTGSLDPLASGLLPVCFGQATKASGLLLDADKTYDVTIALGLRTATGDREGETLEHAAVPALDAATVRRAAAGFLGQITQVPPMYSALKHQGQRLYRLARQGVEVERQPRRVVIHRLDLRSIEGPELRFEIRCSKGTYVRTLAEDLARALGTVGHVARLRRLALGPFDALRMHSLDELEQAPNPEALDALLLPADTALATLPAVRLGLAEQACVLQGQAVFAAGPGGSKVRMYGADGRFLGVGQMSGEGRQLAPDRIMIDLSAPARASA
ncbi:MAG: tRNA pseudouridine(55) synthase TruB [Gammaproteobacteria bacterium]